MGTPGTAGASQFLMYWDAVINCQRCCWPLALPCASAPHQSIPCSLGELYPLARKPEGYSSSLHYPHTLFFGTDSRRDENSATQHYPVGTARHECTWDPTDPTWQQHPLPGPKLQAAAGFATKSKCAKQVCEAQSHQLSASAGTFWSQRQ